MKQRLIVLLIVIVGLGMLVLWARAPEPVAPTKRLEVAGYASVEQLKAAEAQGMFAPQQTIEHPVDGVALGEGPDEVKLVRRGAGKDTTWELTQPIEAVAVSFRVERIIKLFEKTRSSIHSKVIQAADLSLFDLEPERRIRLTLTRGEDVWNDVDLFVGRVEGSDQTQSAPGAEDTWVMVRGESPLRVYRLGGLNIREAVDLTLSELRDKRVFRFKPDQMNRVEVLGPDGAQVTLERTPGVEVEGQAAVNARWTLTQPQGFGADSTVGNLLKEVVNLRAQAFTPIGEGAPQDVSAWLLLTLSSQEGELARLRVSTEAPRALVEGREELIELDERTATTLRVNLDRLRDRTLVPLSPADITQVEINAGRGERLSLIRLDDAWRVSTKGRSAPGQPKDFLKQLVSAKAARFAEPKERDQAEAALGSRPPTLTIMAEGASPLVVSIQPVAQGEDNAEGFWARTRRGTERPEFMWLKNHLRQRLLARFGDLRRKTFFDLSREEIRRVELRNVSGQQSILERQTSEEALSLVGLADTEVVKTATVNTLLNTLTALRAKSFEPKRRAQDVGLTEVATHELLVTRFDGSTVHLTLASQPEGDVVFVRASTGPLKGMIATIPNFQALNLTKSRAQLVDP